jgi:hypothetical protein
MTASKLPSNQDGWGWTSHNGFWYLLEMTIVNWEKGKTKPVSNKTRKIKDRLKN